MTRHYAVTVHQSLSEHAEIGVGRIIFSVVCMLSINDYLLMQVRS